MVGDRAGTSNFEQAKTETSVTEVRFFATEREATLDILQRADDGSAESTLGPAEMGDLFCILRPFEAMILGKLRCRRVVDASCLRSLPVHSPHIVPV